MGEPITESALGLDLSSRLQHTTTVVASPTANAETIIGSLTIAGNPSVVSRILLVGWAAWTVGTSGVTGTLRIRQTDTSGTVIVSSGATTVVATNLVTTSVHGRDLTPVLPGQVYVLTLTVGSGAAASAVSAVSLAALIV